MVSWIVALMLLRPQAQTSLDFRLSSFAELYFAVRSGVKAGLPESVSQVMEGANIGEENLLAMSLIDAVAIRSESPEGFLRECKALPRAITRSGREVPVGAMAVSLAERLVGVPGTDRKAVFRAAKPNLEAKSKVLQAIFAKHPRLIADAAESLGFAQRPLHIPVVLVTRAPAPGSATYRVSPTEAVCMVSVAGPPDTLLIETVLHEALHAIELANQSEAATVLNSLRSQLAKAGVPARDSSEVAHAVLFAQAGASVRKVLYPKHVPYGERKGAYGRMARPGREAVRIWTERREGKVSESEAIRRIVAAAATPGA